VKSLTIEAHKRRKKESKATVHRKRLARLRQQLDRGETVVLNIKTDGTRDEVIAKHERYLADPKQAALFHLLPTLKGKALGCWCSPLPCHGHLLARLANGGPVAVRQFLQERAGST
jgi:hypothetical protein